MIILILEMCFTIAANLVHCFFDSNIFISILNTFSYSNVAMINLPQLPTIYFSSQNLSFSLIDIAFVDYRC